MNKIFVLFLFLLISILSVSCVCAAEVDNTTVTDPSTIDGSLDIDDSISIQLDCESSSGERPLIEVHEVYVKEPVDSVVLVNKTLNDSLVYKSADLFVSDEDINGSDLSVSDEDIDGSDLSDDKDSNGSEIDISGPIINSSENITINGPKLDIKGPKIDVPLNIPGPKGSLQTLQEEINKAPAGSTLRLYMDYIAELSTYMVKINKDLTIDGRGNAIDCQSVQYSGAFLISGGNVVLKNLKIVNSKNPYHGSGTVSISGSAQCTLINCTFENNWGNGNGSVICNKAKNPLTIINCSFVNNEAGNSGIVWSEGVLNVINSSFDSNAAYIKGGAIYAKNDINIFNSSFRSNKATTSYKKCCGGAVCSEGNVQAVNSSFIGNKVSDFGGAICAEKDVVLENCLLESNVANRNYAPGESLGGAIFSNGTVNGINSTFNNNSVEGNDSGIFSAKDVIFDNCLFDSNVENQ